MDDKDIQFLRKKHNNSRNTKFDYCDLCGTRFPCDVVKVLNYYEQNSDCKHMVKEDKENHELDLYAYHLKNWQYCHLCGEKL